MHKRVYITATVSTANNCCALDHFKALSKINEKKFYVSWHMLKMFANLGLKKTNTCILPDLWMDEWEFLMANGPCLTDFDFPVWTWVCNELCLNKNRKQFCADFLCANNMKQRENWRCWFQMLPRHYCIRILCCQSKSFKGDFPTTFSSNNLLGLAVDICVEFLWELWSHDNSLVVICRHQAFFTQ